MQGFNINLDLTDYFDDLRKFSSVFVDLGKCKYIGDIEKHIKRLFGLKNDICLVHEKFLLPGFEDVQLCHQCNTIKVQDRDFKEVKPCNVEEEHLLLNQLALNLIQTEKTVDLSCKPKQRLNVSLNKTPDNILDESPQYFDNYNQLKESCHNYTYSLTNSKEKHKKKKKRTKRDCDEGDGSNILDMSLNKVRKYSHDNCFLPSSDCSSKELIDEKKWLCEEKDQKPLLKHRKKILKPSSVNKDLSISSYIEDSLASKEFVNKTIANKNDSFESQYTVLKSYDNTNEAIFQGKDDDILEKNNKVSHKNPLVKSERKSGNSDILLKERKEECQNHIDTLLGSPRIINSTPSENIENLNSNFVTGLLENNHDLQNNSLSNNGSENETSQTGDSIKRSLSESSNTRFKRKRKRKHKKNKQNQYLQAIGPVLQNLEVNDYQFTSLTLNSNRQRTSSLVAAKHIYFEDDDNDFVEENLVDSTKSSCSKTSLQGLYETEKANSLNGFKDQESSCVAIPKWQEEIFKLTKAPKPLKVERFPKLTIKSPQSNAYSQEHSLKSESYNAKQKNEGNAHVKTVQTTDGDDVEACNKEDKCNDTENDCKSEVNVLSEKLQDSVMPLIRDLQNIVLSNYPVIDKVVPNDIILFQVLKLNELNEPDISNRILAKVKNVTNFPNQILLHIIEGLEECGESIRRDTNNEEDTVEYKWTDLIEPRLLYP